MTETRGYKKNVLEEPKYRRSKDTLVPFYINEKGERVLQCGWGGFSDLSEMLAGADLHGQEIIVSEEWADEEEGMRKEGSLNFFLHIDKTEIDEQAVFDIHSFEAAKREEVKIEHKATEEKQKTETLREIYQKVKSQVSFEEFCKNFK